MYCWLFIYFSTKFKDCHLCSITHLHLLHFETLEVILAIFLIFLIFSTSFFSLIKIVFFFSLTADSRYQSVYTALKFVHSI